MSWRAFERLIQEKNTDITAWMNAIESNPNTPEDALWMTLVDLYDRQDVDMLKRFASIIIDLVRNADGLLDTIIQGDTGVTVIGVDNPQDHFIDVGGLFQKLPYDSSEPDADESYFDAGLPW